MKTYLSLILTVPFCLVMFTGEASQVRRLSLDDCIKMALDMNPQMGVAEEDVNIAIARRKQARSAYFPDLEFSAFYTHLDSDPVFIVPPTGFLREQLMKKDIYNFTATLKYPLYTGGMIKNLNQQAKLGVEVAKAGRQGSERDVVFEVRQRYLDVQMADELYRIAQKAAVRLQVLLDITERLYKEGSGKVTKTDYLQTKMLVGSVKNQVVRFKEDAKLAKEGLKRGIGLDTDEPIELAERLKYIPHKFNLEESLEEAYQNYPEWRQLDKGIEAKEAGVKVAKSGYFPKVALVGTVSHTEDHFGNLGLLNDSNQPLLAIGAVLSMPIFDGFLNYHKVQEAKADLAKTKSQKEMLNQGLAVMVKKAHSDLEKGMSQVEITRQVMADAVENEDLTKKSYEVDLMELEDVIKAQMIAALAETQHTIAVYHYEVAWAELNKALGRAY